MNNNESKIWEKFYGKKVCSENLNIEGFKKPIPFDIYDGHAICEDYRGHRFDMVYPQLKAVKDSKELSDAVIEYIGEISDKSNAIHGYSSLNAFVNRLESSFSIISQATATRLLWVYRAMMSSSVAMRFGKWIVP